MWNISELVSYMIKQIIRWNLKGALQLGGESINFGRNSSSRTECRMATQNSYNTSASFEAGLSLVQTENGARIENGKSKWNRRLWSMTLFSNPTLGRESYRHYWARHHQLMDNIDAYSTSKIWIRSKSDRWYVLLESMLDREWTSEWIDESIPIVRICTTKEDPTAFESYRILRP
jgi:hypothetical protein